MTGSKFTFLTILSVSALSLISAQVNKLNIDIHYESRCPDSRSFIQNQLRGAYQKIKDKVVINYVPFGKANSFSRNGETLFTCQHGVRECDGNKFQSCCIDVIGKTDQDRQTAFVICAMDFSKNAYNCAQNLGLDMTKVNDCVNGEKGTELQLEAEEYSRDIINRSGFVPTIVYNSKYQAGDFWASLEDFEGVVNDRLQNI